METSCIMNDNGADSFKSAWGLLKTQLTRLREPFTGQEPQPCRQEELRGNKELLPCWALYLPHFPLPVKMLNYDAAQRSRNASKVREAQKTQWFSLGAAIS